MGDCHAVHESWFSDFNIPLATQSCLRTRQFMYMFAGAQTVVPEKLSGQFCFCSFVSIRFPFAFSNQLCAVPTQDKIQSLLIGVRELTQIFPWDTHNSKVIILLGRLSNSVSIEIFFVLFSIITCILKVSPILFM